MASRERGAFLLRRKHIRLFISAVLAAACFVVPASGWAHHEPVKIRYFMNRCDQQHPLDCIHRASLHRHVPFRTMTGIAWRESRWNPWAKNSQSTASGLFQFLNTTWAATPYARRPVFSAKWNSLAAAYLMSQPGGMSHWALTYR